MNIDLLGLPGLYQNWIMAAVDPDSQVQLHGTQNFFCAKSKVKWLIKPGLEHYPRVTNDHIVINLYVDHNNYPWYLYNLFEKTYDIKIMIDNFVNDLMAKGDKFSIFADFKRDLSTFNYRNQDELINYFYELFENKNHYLYKAVRHTHDEYINIEYSDFNDPIILKEKLSVIPVFNSNHFDNLYQLLAKRNQRYLNRKIDFVNKLNQNQSFDLIEEAYIGIIASKIHGKKLNWKDQRVRKAILSYKLGEVHQMFV